MSDKHDATSKLRTKPGPKPRLPPDTSPAGLTEKLRALEEEYGVNLYQASNRDETGKTRLGTDKDETGASYQQKDSAYPVRLYAPDSYDDIAKMKAEYAKQKDAAPFGQVFATAEDFEWMKAKKDAKTAAAYKQWVLAQYNLADPAQRPLMEKMYPGLFSEMEQEIDSRAELEKKLAKIRLRGAPSGADEAQLLFAIASQAVQLPAGQLWNPSSWTDRVTESDKNSLDDGRGLFSFTKMWRAGKRVKEAPTDLLGGALGVQNVPTSAALLGGVSTDWDAANTKFGSSLWAPRV